MTSRPGGWRSTVSEKVHKWLAPCELRNESQRNRVSSRGVPESIAPLTD